MHRPTVSSRKSSARRARAVRARATRPPCCYGRRNRKVAEIPGWLASTCSRRLQPRHSPQAPASERSRALVAGAATATSDHIRLAGRRFRSQVDLQISQGGGVTGAPVQELRCPRRGDMASGPAGPPGWAGLQVPGPACPPRTSVLSRRGYSRSSQGVCAGVIDGRHALPGTILLTSLESHCLWLG